MDFAHHKRVALTRLQAHDRSRAGGVDERIKAVVNRINSLDDFYTTSSCAGRVMVTDKPENGRKNETRWLLASHDPITFKQLDEAIKQARDETWFMMEPAILHIGARDTDTAQRMLHAANQAGLKRGGAIAMGERIILEVKGVEEIAAPLARQGGCLVDERYLRTLVAIAGAKLERNQRRIEKLLEELENL